MRQQQPGPHVGTYHVQKEPQHHAMPIYEDNVAIVGEKNEQETHRGTRTRNLLINYLNE